MINKFVSFHFELHANATMDTKNVYNSSKPFLTLLKFFGLFPLTLNKKQIWETTALDVFSTVFAVFAFICLGAISLMDVFSYDIGSKILATAWSFTYKIAIFLQLLLMSYQLWKRKELASVLTSLHNVDAKVFYHK